MSDKNIHQKINISLPASIMSLLQLRKVHIIISVA